MDKKLKENIKCIESRKDILNINNKTAKYIINTKYTQFISKVYFIFHINQKKDILDIFDSFNFIYNGITSNITSEFIKLLLNLYNDEKNFTFIKNMLMNNPIYLRIPFFFYNNPLYVFNQEISFELTNIKFCDKIEIYYDNNIVDDCFLSNYIMENKIILIEIFSMIQSKNIEIIEIPNNNIQELFWTYKNNNNKYIHPVQNIAIMYDYDNYIIRERDPLYFINVSSYINHTNMNENVYSYSFIFNPEIFLPHKIINENIKYIKLVQKIDEKYNQDYFLQMICIKSFYLVDLI